MRKASVLTILVCLLAISNMALADTFGSGTNQFTIDFVPISGSTNPTSGYGIVNNDFRMGTYEIANDQWNKFTASLGVPITGNERYAYDQAPRWTGMNLPTNNASWYEAAQFVNWLNTSTGHQAAYKFTGTQGTNNYTLVPWQAADAGYAASNPYRNRNAYYFLPTENEWFKAAYWNGTAIQTWATPDGSRPVAGIDTNYFQSVSPGMTGPWNANGGSEELNGTFNMMGNVLEWMENPYNNGEYTQWASRCLRGGSYYFTHDEIVISSSTRDALVPYEEDISIGFRVASVPEPASAMIMMLGAVWMAARRKR